MDMAFVFWRPVAQGAHKEDSRFGEKEPRQHQASGARELYAAI